MSLPVSRRLGLARSRLSAAAAARPGPRTRPEPTVSNLKVTVTVDSESELERSGSSRSQGLSTGRASEVASTSLPVTPFKLDGPGARALRLTGT